MTKEEFIKFLKDNEIPHKISNLSELYAIYIYGKPRPITDPSDGKKRDFTPYLRVTHFDENGKWYTRFCGICGYKSIDWILSKCLELKKSFKEENNG